MPLPVLGSAVLKFHRNARIFDVGRRVGVIQDSGSEGGRGRISGCPIAWVAPEVLDAMPMNTDLRPRPSTEGDRHVDHCHAGAAGGAGAEPPAIGCILRAVTPASDVYMLGGLMFEVLTCGQVPFFWIKDVNTLLRRRRCNPDSEMPVVLPCPGLSRSDSGKVESNVSESTAIDSTIHVSVMQESGTFHSPDLQL